MSFYEKTASELAVLLDRGQCTSVELTQAHYDRIEAVDGTVKAFLTLTREQALARAAEIDGKRARGEALGALAGIPIALKDNICTKGVRTTCASKMLENFVPPYSATVVDRLEAADAVILGKLNMDEFAMGSSCENSYFQQTVNPRGLDRVPGGSSGGSGAAVAAGETPLALGTDTGGSARLPASYCGVIGVKPTYGAVSRFGAVAFGSSLDQICPMTRCVEDAARLLGVLVGPDDKDATSARRTYPDFVAGLGAGVKGKTIGIPREYFGVGVDSEVAAAVMAAAAELEKQGATLKEVSLPSTTYALSAYYVISSAEASSNLARFDGVRYGYRTAQCDDLGDLYEKSRSEGFGEEVKRRIMLGTAVLSSGYYDAYYKRSKLVQQRIAAEFAEVFAGCDLLVTPTAPSTAFRLGENLGDPVKMYASDICTVPVSIAGLPAVAVPCGTAADGMPMGMQLVAPRFSEGMLLAAARLWEQLSGGWNTVPQIEGGRA